MSYFTVSRTYSFIAVIVSFSLETWVLIKSKFLKSATKFEKIAQLQCNKTFLANVKSLWVIFSNFVALSDYTDFIKPM